VFAVPVELHTLVPEVLLMQVPLVGLMPVPVELHTLVPEVLLTRVLVVGLMPVPEDLATQGLVAGLMPVPEDLHTPVQAEWGEFRPIVAKTAAVLSACQR
jgi:hypothetical protein